MKPASLLLLATSLLALPAPAAPENPRPKGFAGASWGATQAEVIRALHQRGLKVPEEIESPDTLEATGGSFAGQDAAKWTFDFTNGKFSAAAVVIKPTDSPSALYRDFKQQFIAKYGPAAGEKKLGSASEERVARYNGSSLSRLVKGTAVTWKFGPSIGDQSTLSIVVELASEAAEESESILTVRYINETLRTPPAHAARDKTPGKTGKPETPAKAARPVKGDDL